MAGHRSRGMIEADVVSTGSAGGVVAAEQRQATRADPVQRQPLPPQRHVTSPMGHRGIAQENCPKCLTILSQPWDNISVPGSPGESRKEAQMVKVMVEEVAIAAHSTIGIARGKADDGTVVVTFAGPWQAMESLGWAMVAAGEPIAVEVEDWQVLDVAEVPTNPEG